MDLKNLLITILMLLAVVSASAQTHANRRGGSGTTTSTKRSASTVTAGTTIQKIDTSNILSLTAPGEAKYIDKLSYFILDEAKTKELVKNKLVEKEEVEETSTSSK